MLFKKITKNSGYTILEVLVALSILITGIFAVLTLTVSSMSNTDAALDYLVAGNLAREGIELVRNKRDTNWYLSGNAFDAGLTNPTLYRAIVDYNDVGLTFVDYDIGNSACKLLRAGSVYSYDVGGALSGFSRLIYFRNICYNVGVESIENSAQDVCAVGKKIGIDIVSKVQWTNPQLGAKTVEINNRLYDWR